MCTFVCILVYTTTSFLWLTTSCIYNRTISFSYWLYPVFRVYHFLSVCRLRAESNNQIVLRFRTTASQGLLLLVHKSATVAGDYLAIALNFGRAEVSFNLGKERSTDLLFIRSPVRVNDGQWHTLYFTRYEGITTSQAIILLALKMIFMWLSYPALNCQPIFIIWKYIYQYWTEPTVPSWEVQQLQLTG